VGLPPGRPWRDVTRTSTIEVSLAMPLNNATTNVTFLYCLDLPLSVRVKMLRSHPHRHPSPPTVKNAPKITSMWHTYTY